MLVEPLRLALQMAHEWSEPIAIACADAEAAFESIQHSVLVAGWEYLGAHPLMVAAMYREMAAVHAEVVICGETGGTSKLTGGGRPGEVTTPAHWNVGICYALRKLVPSWVARGFGYRRGSLSLLILVWADDFTLVAASASQLRTMLGEFHAWLQAHGIQLKESKCKWMASEAALQQQGETEGAMNIEGVEFTRVDSMEVLGSSLTPSADSLSSIRFCIRRAWHHWFQRRSQLCRRRVPLLKRIERYLSTVGLTLLYGTEGLIMTQGLLKEVQSFDRHCLREMLCMKKPDVMGWTEFRRRQHRILRRALDALGRVELSGQLLLKQFGWAGHVARMCEDPLAAQWATECSIETWRIQQAVGESSDRYSKRSRWRHKRRGPIRRWDSLIGRVLGSAWWTLAQDRDAWKAMRFDFVRGAATALLGAGHRLFGTTD
jgi:hypothetical protein